MKNNISFGLKSDNLWPLTWDILIHFQWSFYYSMLQCKTRKFSSVGQFLWIFSYLLMICDCWRHSQENILCWIIILKTIKNIIHLGSWSCAVILHSIHCSLVNGSAKYHWVIKSILDNNYSNCEFFRLGRIYRGNRIWEMQCFINCKLIFTGTFIWDIILIIMECGWLSLFYVVSIPSLLFMPS